MLIIFVFSLPFLFIFLNVNCHFIMSPPSCHNVAELDVVFAVDNTYSMFETGKIVKRQIPAILKEILHRYPRTRFGYLSFNDKDRSCKGGQKNYCAAVESPLTNKSEIIQEQIKDIVSIWGGGEPAEDTLGALLVAALSPALDWNYGLKKDIKRYNLVIVVTDALYNQPTINHQYDCRPDMARSNDGNGDYDCLYEDFPTVLQVKAGLRKHNITPIFLLSPSNETVHEFHWSENKQIYEDLIQDLNVAGWVNHINVTVKSFVTSVYSAFHQILCTTPTTTTTEALTSMLSIGPQTKRISTSKSNRFHTSYSITSGSGLHTRLPKTQKSIFSTIFPFPTTVITTVTTTVTVTVTVTVTNKGKSNSLLIGIVATTGVIVLAAVSLLAYYGLQPNSSQNQLNDPWESPGSVELEEKDQAVPVHEGVFF